MYGLSYGTMETNIIPPSADFSYLDEEQSPSNDPANISNFTLLIYMVGSDLEDISQEASKDIEEMLKSKLNNEKSGVNILIHSGGSKIQKVDPHSKNEIDFSKMNRHALINNTIYNFALSNMSSDNMGNETTLSEFIKWGVGEFPAKKYGLILWDHGGNVAGFGKDENFPENTQLYLYELGNAFLASIDYLKYDRVFEFIGFDSCLMGSLEVATMLGTGKPIARYLIASEEIEPNWGWNYTAILNYLNNNSDFDGAAIGKNIVQSYEKHSNTMSKAEKFSAERDITLSVIDLRKIPELVTQINNLKDIMFYYGLTEDPNEVDAHLKFFRTIDMTEHYGQKFLSGTGNIDLYGFISNLENYFPALQPQTNIIKQIINSSVVYSHHGKSHPESHGISVYLPLYYSFDEFKVLDDITDQEQPKIPPSDIFSMKWLDLIMYLQQKTKSDTDVPLINSQRNGSNIDILIRSNDISTIYVSLILESNDGKKFQFLQSLDPSLVNKNGLLNYNIEGKILGLCNEISQKCIPVSANQDYSQGITKIFIPVKVEKSNNKIQEDLTLSYEWKNQTFFFLGSTKGFTIKGAEPISKEKISIEEGDKIFSQASNVSPYYISSSTSVQNHLKTIFGSSFKNTTFLNVDNPLKITPRFININFSSLVFYFCDYSDNCVDSRQYYKNATNDRLNFHSQKPPYILKPLSQSIPLTKTDQDKGYYYINEANGFQLKYPLDWFSVTANIDDSNFTDSTYMINDPTLVLLSPLDEYVNDTDNSDYVPPLEVDVRESYDDDDIKLFFNFFNDTNIESDLEGKKRLFKIVDSNYFNIKDYRGFEFLIESPQPGKTWSQSTESDISYFASIKIKDKLYTFNYANSKSHFFKYYDTINNIISTLDTVNFSEFVNNKFEYQMFEEKELTNQILSIIKKGVSQNIEFKNYSNPSYELTFQYPSFIYMDLGSPVNDSSSQIRENQLYDRLDIFHLYLLSSHLSFDQISTPEMAIKIYKIKESYDKNSLEKNLFMTNLTDWDRIENDAITSFKIGRTLPTYDLLDSSISDDYFPNWKGVVDKEIYTYYGNKIIQKNFYVIIDDKLIHFYLRVPSDDFEFYDSIFDKTVKSFKFIN